MRELDFSEVILPRCWREIRPHLRKDVLPCTRHLLKHLLQAGLLDGEREVSLWTASISGSGTRQVGPLTVFIPVQAVAILEAADPRRG